MWNKALEFFPEWTENDFLPFSDHLVALCKKVPRLSNYSENKLLTKMRMDLLRDYCDGYIQNLSIPEMWLLFLMKHQFSKKWNQARKKWL